MLHVLVQFNTVKTLSNVKHGKYVDIYLAYVTNKQMFTLIVQMY